MNLRPYVTEEQLPGVLLATMSDRFLSGVVEQLGLSSYSMLALYVFIFVAVGGVVRRHFMFNLVGWSQYCPPRHLPHVGPSFRELNDIL